MALHRINKVSLDFSFSKEEEETALEKTKQLFYTKIVPQLNNRFDGVKEQVYIERLEIDIAQTTAETFETDFFNAFVKSFEACAAVHKSTATAQPARDNSFTFEQVLFFLQKGYWSWNIQQRSEKEITTLLRTFFEKEQQVILLLQRLQTEQAFAAERLIDLVFKHTIHRLLISALTTYHPAFRAVWALLADGWEKEIKAGNGFYFYLLRDLLLSAPLQHQQELFTFLKQFITSAFFTAISTASETQQLLAIIEKNAGAATLNRFFSQLQQLLNTNKKNTAQAIAPLAEVANTHADQYVSGIPFFGEAATEKITISNAGLILFHPYLHLVFQELNWIGPDKKFIDARVQRKAVLFLQYLINGKSRQAEHVLVLNKILCNWPVHLPLRTACNFSVKEKQAAVELMASLKEHWTVLKNTSPQGVIESFVQRPGLIQKTATGFLLQVERKTIDILMDTLPFGINTIKLPWNENIIHAEW